MKHAISYAYRATPHTKEQMKMGRYNTKFELSVEDMELIEDALRQSKAQKPEPVTRQIHDLLGRLHNQKVFYRPKSAPYVGG